MQFVVSVSTVTLVAVAIPIVFFVSAVFSVGAPFDFLRQVMESGRPQILDRHHELMYSLVGVPISFMVFPVTVFALTLPMDMLHFLGEFAFHAFGFLVAVVLL